MPSEVKEALAESIILHDHLFARLSRAFLAGPDELREPLKLLENDAPKAISQFDWEVIRQFALLGWTHFNIETLTLPKSAGVIHADPGIGN